MANFEYCEINESIDSARLAWNSGTYRVGEYLPVLPGMPLVPGEVCFAAPAVLGQRDEFLVAERYREFIRRIGRLESTLKASPVKGVEYSWDSGGYHWVNPDDRVNSLLNLVSKGMAQTADKVFGELMEGEGDEVRRLPLSLWDVLREVDLERFQRQARPGDLYEEGELQKYKGCLKGIPANLEEEAVDGYKYTWDSTRETLLPLRQRLLSEALEALEEIGEDKASALASCLPPIFGM